MTGKHREERSGMFDINRGAVRKRIYWVLEHLSGFVGSVAAAVLVLSTLVANLTDLGVTLPEGTVAGVSAVVTFVALVNKYVLKMAGANVAIADAVDALLEPLDSTPETEE